MDITQILLLLGAVQGLLLGAVLFRKTQTRRGNQFLAVLLVLIAFQTYLLSMDQLYHFLGCAVVNVFSRVIFLLYGPLIYFYVRSHIDSSFLLSRKHFLHFLPFAFFSVCNVIAYQIWDPQSSLIWIHYLANTHYFYPDFYAYLRLLYLLTYLLLSVYWLTRYREKGQQFFSNGTHLQVSWLYQFLVASFFLWGIVAVGLRVNFFDGNPHSNAFQSIFFVLPAFLYWVSYKALTQSVFFVPLTLSEVNTNETIQKKIPKSNREKYNRSGLSTALASQIERRLVVLMKREKPHLKPDLKLGELAQLLDIAPHYLSQVLNEQLGCNFYEFVNQYRIEEAKRHLRDASFAHYTIEAIAYESGFNSKSTFNSLFKKQLGKTPRQWRKEGLSDN